MIRWCVYYVDGKTFSHLDGDPWCVPGGGVAAIAQEDETVGVLIHHQNDFYCFDKSFNGWQGMDAFGLAQYLMKPGLKVIKLGEVMGTEEYKKLIHSLHKDPGLPDKSARYPWEVGR